MARQQTEAIPRVPRLVPAAQGASGFVGAQAPPGATRYDLRFVDALGDRARRFFFDLEERRADALLEKSRADLADSGQLVEELLEAVGDEDGRAQALKRAQERGLIPASLSPTFKLALAEAEGRRAAQRAAQSASARILRGEHLPTPDGNGNLTGGLDVARIYDEELGRYEKSPALGTKIGAAAFNSEVAMSRPALLQAAGDQRAEVEIRHLRGIIEDEIAGKVRLLHDIPAEELPGRLQSIEETANQLHRLGVEDVRGTITTAIARGLTLIGTTDPDQALLVLNTAVGDIRIAGETLDENPRTSEMLSLQRHKWRRASDEHEGLEGRERERRVRENTRLADDLIGTVVRREREAGTPVSEARRIARAEWEETLLTRYPRSADLQENPGLFEEIRLHGLQLIDALTAERIATDPTVHDALVRKLALATSQEELSTVRAEAIESEALSGLDLQRFLGEVDSRLQGQGLGALESNPTFGRAWSELARVPIPDGLPASSTYQVEDELDDLRAAFLSEAQALVDVSGRFDAAKLQQLGQDYRARMQTLVRERSVALEEAQREATEAIQNNATADEVRRIAAGRISFSQEVALVEAAEDRQRRLMDLLDEPMVRGQVEEVVAALEADAGAGAIPGMRGVGTTSPFEDAALRQELRSQYLAMLRTELAGKNVDLISGRSVLSEKGRQWTIDTLKRMRDLRASEDEAAAEGKPQLPMGQRELVEQATGQGGEADDAEVMARRAALFEDANTAAERLAAQPTTALTGNPQALTSLAPQIDHRVFQTWHSVAGTRGSWTRDPVERSFSSARGSLEYEAIRASRRNGSDLGATYIAAVSPLGIPLDDILAGKTTVQPGARYVLSRVGERAFEDVGVLGEAVEVKLDATLIPPFTTPIFSSKQELKTRWKDLDPLFQAWGISSPEDEALWAKTQEGLIELVAAKKAMTQRTVMPKAEKIAGKYGPRPAVLKGISARQWGYTEEL